MNNAADLFWMIMVVLVVVILAGVAWRIFR